MTFSLKFILQPQRPSGIQVIKNQIHKLQFTLCNICVSDKETFSTLGLYVKFLISNKFYLEHIIQLIQCFLQIMHLRSHTEPGRTKPASPVSI